MIFFPGAEWYIQPYHRSFDWLQEQVNDLFEDFPLRPATRGLFDRAVSPAMDVIENPDAYTAECELPGMDQK